MGRVRKRPKGHLDPDHFNPTAEYEVVNKLAEAQPTWMDPTRAHQRAGDADFREFLPKVCALCRVQELSREAKAKFETDEEAT